MADALGKAGFSGTEPGVHFILREDRGSWIRMRTAAILLNMSKLLLGGARTSEVVGRQLPEESDRQATDQERSNCGGATNHIQRDVPFWLACVDSCSPGATPTRGSVEPMLQAQGAPGR